MLPYTVSTVMAVLFTAAVYNLARRGWRWENGGALLLSFCLGMWHLVFFLLIAPASLFLVIDRETRSAFWSPFAVRLAAVVLLPLALGVLAPWVLGAVDLHMVGRLFAAGEFNKNVFSILPFWLLLTAGLGLAGGWLAQDRLRARLWVATAAALVLFMFGGAWFISGVEPWRFGAPLSLFLLFPAAVYAASLFSPENRDTRASVMVLGVAVRFAARQAGQRVFLPAASRAARDQRGSPVHRRARSTRGAFVCRRLSADHRRAIGLRRDARVRGTPSIPPGADGAGNHRRAIPHLGQADRPSLSPD